MRIPKNKWLYLALALVLAFIIFKSCKKSEQEQSYYTAEIVRKDIATAITATGTVEPEEVIDVGAQVAGQILSFGKDAKDKTIDYGSEIEEGTVLAQIDDSLYRSDMEKASAELLRAQADVQQNQAKLIKAEHDWRRAEKVGSSDLLSKSSYDSYRAEYEVAKANVAVSQAQAAQAQAGLAKAQRNLSYTIIKSPVKGVIIDRRVNIGQTVVASLNAPSLFLIAKDLRRMQVWVSVNEADIGNIYKGQPVEFTVDAFPGEVFRGEVIKVRLNAAMTQNVVTYIVEVSTDNSSGKLFPYLTANVRFEGKSKSNVLAVPNAALRWSPKGNSAQENTAARQGEARIWILDSKQPKPLTVRPGLSDGSFTEVEGSELKEGLIVILGENIQTAGAKSSEQVSPFTPQPMRGKRN